MLKFVKKYILYAIIDIEATGGNSKNGKITEVAIFCFDGQQITKEFSSLVNPQMGIPPYVQHLTGITNKMVSTAPLFAEIAPQIYKLLNNNYFVAHNVKADYNFIQAELSAVGYQFKSERLCTLELSKKIFPEAPSHGLSKICKFLNIKLPNQHRAAADALATLELFKLLKQKDEEGLLKKLTRKA